MSKFINPDIPFFLNSFPDNGKSTINALGTVYFGEPNLNAKQNPKSPYLDSELETPTASKQDLTGAGKLQQKLWLDGSYSLIVEDSGGNQIYEDLDFAGLDGGDDGGGVEPPPEEVVNNNNLGLLAARMAAGEPVSICFYGDSTTDGNNTTDWIPNPVDGSGNAIGNTNHTAVAAFAYPNVLQTILRDMFNNPNIAVYNAGYQGRRIEDGWAVNNYSAAVVDNLNYGIPDITVIQFGINDVQGIGDVITRFMDQSRILMQRLIDDSTMPILATCDPVWQNGGFGPNTIDQKEVRRQLDQAKKTLAEEFGVPLWDIGSDILNWVQDNTDGYAWAQIQPDKLHFNDRGHGFKASAFAKEFFNDLFIFDGGDEYLNSISSQSAFLSDDVISTYYLSNNKQGGNIVFTLEATPESDLLTAWCWITCPNTHMHYLGIDNENVSTATTLPQIIIENQIDQSTPVVKELSRASIPGPNQGFGYSDDTTYCGKLEYGLNKVVYRASNTTSAYLGGLRFTESSKVLPSNCIAHMGNSVAFHVPAGPAPVIIPFPEAKDLSNVLPGSVNDESYIIELDVNLVEETGVIIAYGQGFDNSQDAVTNNQQTAIVLYRVLGGQLALWALTFDGIDNSFKSFDIIDVSAGALPWTNNNFSGRVEIFKEPLFPAQFVQVRDDRTDPSAALVINYSGGSADLRWGGICGGLYIAAELGSYVPGEISVNELRIRREVFF